MDKKALRKITVGGPSSTVIATAGILPPDTKKHESKKEYNIISAKLVDDILVLSSYSHNKLKKVCKDRLPDFVTYCSVTDNSYISRCPSSELDGKVKWYSASLENKLEGYYYSQEHHEWITPSALFASSEDSKVVADYFGFPNEEVLCSLKNWQSDILEIKREKKHQKAVDELTEIMKVVPEKPEGLDEWFYTNVLRNYLITDAEGCSSKQVHVTCTGCNKDAIVTKSPQFRHNRFAACPICGKPVKSVSRGIYKRSGWLSEYKKITVIQKISKNTFVFRYFSGNAKLRFQLNFREIDSSLYEIARDFVTISGKSVSYKRYEMQKKNGKHDFWPSPDNGNRIRTGFYPIAASGLERYAYGSFLYTENLDEVLSNAKWEHFPLKELGTHYIENPDELYETNYFEYGLEAYLKAPAIEKMIKVGLYGLSMYLCSYVYERDNCFDYKADSLLGILKLRNRTELEHLKVKDNYRTLKYLQKISSLKIDLSDEDWNLALGAFNDLYALSPDSHTMEKLHKECPDLIPKKFLAYLMKQTKTKKLGIAKDWNTHNFYASFVNEYIDYRNDLKFVGIPISRKNAYPEDLHEAHKLLRKQVDMKQKLIELNQLKALNKKLDKAAKLFEKKLVESGLITIEDNFYGFEDNAKYCLLLPHSKEALSLEGAALDHCVGSAGYDEKIANRESVIIFLRKQDAKGKSYYTMEYDLKSHKFLQCRTVGDGSADHFGAETFESKRALFNALASPSGILSVKTETDIRKLLKYSKLKRSDKAIVDLIAKDAVALIKNKKYAYQSDEYKDLTKMHIKLDEYFAKGKNITDTVIRNAFEALKNSTSGRSAVKEFRDKLEKALAA